MTTSKLATTCPRCGKPVEAPPFQWAEGLVPYHPECLRAEIASPLVLLVRCKVDGKLRPMGEHKPSR